MNPEAFCHNCNNLFRLPISIPSGPNITLENNIWVTRCPRCGSTTVTEIDTRLIGNARSLIGAFRNSADFAVTADTFLDVAGRIKSEKDLKGAIANELKLYARWIPQSFGDWMQFMAVLIALIALVRAETNKPAPAVNTTINNTYFVAPPTPIDTATWKAQHIGRNESCPCGSGRKYKKCHGKE